MKLRHTNSDLHLKMQAALLLPLILLVIIPPLISIPKASAQPADDWWAAGWMLIDSDENEPGADNFRDVQYAYMKYDPQYLYLRLVTYENPGWGNYSYQDARYSWYFDVNTVTDPATVQGTNLRNSEYKLFLEDPPKSSHEDDGLGDLYLIKDLNGEGAYSDWETTRTNNYQNNGTALWSKFRYSRNEGGQLVPNPTDIPQESDDGDLEYIGFRIESSSVYMYVRWDAIDIQFGVYDFANFALFYSTDNEKNNLDSAEDLDRPKVLFGIPFPKTVSIALEKYTNGFEADDAPGPYISIGGEVVWNYTITNTGELPLHNITLVDDKIVGSISVPNTSLAPGKSMYAIVNGTAEAGQYSNYAIVRAEAQLDIYNVAVYDADPSHYFGKDMTSPTIPDLWNDPEPPIEHLQSTKVFVNATDNVAVDHVTIEYLGSAYAMRLNSTSMLWEHTIPGQAAGANFTVKVKAYDAANNSATTAFQKWWLDQTGPSIISIANNPEPPIEHMHPTLVLVNASDNVGVARVTIEWLDSGLREMTYNASKGLWTYTIPGYAAGANFTVKVKAYDAANNSATTAFQKWWLDQTAPIIVDLWNDPEPPLEHLQSTKVFVNASDNVGVDHIAIKYLGSDHNMLYNGTSKLWEHLITGYPAGTNITVLVEVYDAVGNHVQESFNKWWTDQTKPTIIGVVNDPEPPLEHMQSTLVLLNATDNVGIDHVTIEWPSHAAERMTYNSTSKLWESTVPGHPVGTNTTVTVKAYDAAGNHANATFEKWWIDKTAPIIIRIENDPEPPLEHMQPTLVYVNASDNVGVTRVTLEWLNSGLKEMTYNTSEGLWTYTIPGYATGVNFTVTAVAYDAAGHSTQSTFQKWWLDQTEPTILDLWNDPEPPIGHLQSTKVFVNATDNVAVDHVTIKYDGSAYAMEYNSTSKLWEYTIAGHTATTNITVVVEVYDAIGNHIQESFSKWWTDQTKPTIISVVNSPEPPLEHMQSTQVLVNATDNVGVDHVTIEWPTHPAEVITYNVTSNLWEYIIIGQPAGTAFNATVKAYDAAGNYSNTTFEKWWIDKTAPTIISIENDPEPPLAHNRSTQVLVNATDNVGVVNVTIQWTGSILYNMTYNSTLGLWEYTMPGQPKGTNFTVTVTAYDAAKHSVNSTFEKWWVFATIRGIVFNDNDSDGMIDPEETGIPGVLVTLYSNYTQIANTTTDESGYYVFTIDEAGIYAVVETDLAGYVSTTPNEVHSVIALGDSDEINFGDLNTGAVSPAVFARIKGTVYEDMDHNGVFGRLEPGIEGVTVKLYNGTTLLQTVTTDKHGTYGLEVYGPGSYTVIETDLPGYVSTTPNEVPLEITQKNSNPDVNFGDFKGAIISGIVFNDGNLNRAKDSSEEGIPEVTVAVDDDITQTDSTGLYKLYTAGSIVTVSETNLGGWLSTCVVLHQPGSMVEISYDAVEVTISYGSTYGVDFGDVRITDIAVISGTVFYDRDEDGVFEISDNETGIPDVLVTSSSGISVKTDSGGYYEIPVKPGGTYQITSSRPTGLPWYPTTPESVSVPTTSAGLYPGVDFGYSSDLDSAVIYGVVYHDANSNGAKDPDEGGVAGATITLFMVGEPQTTTGTGEFRFTVYGTGIYSISEKNPPGWLSTTVDDFAINVSQLGQLYYVDFGDIPDQTPPEIVSYANDPEPPLAHLQSTLALVNATDNLNVTHVTIEWLGQSAVEMAYNPTSELWEYTIPGQSAGTNFTVTVKAYDASNNHDEVSFYKWWIDTVPPVITGVLNVPEPPLEHLQPTVAQVMATDNVKVDRATIEWPSSGVNNMAYNSASLFWEYTIPGQSAGTNFTAVVKVYDAANNSATTTFQKWWLDQTGPSIISVANDPEPPIEHMHPTLVLVDASDNVGVTRVTLEWLDSGLMEMVYNASLGRWLYTIPGYAAGVNFTATVVAYDAVGHSIQSTFEKWWTDQSGPSIISVANSPEPPLEHREPTKVIVNATDNVAVTRITIQWLGMTAADMTYNSTTGFWTYTIPGQDAGTSFNVTIKAYDEAGNYKTATFPKWWIDKTAPVILTVNQTSDAPLLGENVTITAHVTDNAGVRYVIITYDGVARNLTLRNGTSTDGYWMYLIQGPTTETTIAFTITAYDGYNNATYGPHSKHWSTPEITMWPTQGYSDTTIYGKGFTPNSTISITWGNGTITTTPITITSNENGQFTAILNRVSLDKKSGNYTVKAIDHLGKSDTDYFVALPSPKGLTGSAGQVGQDMSPGYLAGWILIYIIIAAVTALVISRRTRRGETTTPPPPTTG